jgi:hypothetical protein
MENDTVDNKEKIGIYGETPRIKIGEFTICEQTNPPRDTVWIENERGERGEFRKDLIEFDIEEIFNKYY